MRLWEALAWLLTEGVRGALAEPWREELGVRLPREGDAGAETLSSDVAVTEDVRQSEGEGVRVKGVALSRELGDCEGVDDVVGEKVVVSVRLSVCTADALTEAEALEEAETGADTVGCAAYCRCRARGYGAQGGRKARRRRACTSSIFCGLQQTPAPQ